MKKAIRKINSIFISIILVIFYLFIVGIAKLTKKLSLSNKEIGDSTFWITSEQKQIEDKDFESSY